MNCERCNECESLGRVFLRFADEVRPFELCSDCLDFYRFAIEGDGEELEELEEDFEDLTDPCEVAFDEIVESTEDPE